MSNATMRLSEQWEVVDYFKGDAIAAASEQNTGYVSCARFHRIAVIVCPVDINDALDVDIEQATDTAGSGAKSFHSGDHDITVATADTLPSFIEIDCSEFDVSNLFDCLNVEVTPGDTGGNANDFAVLILGLPRYAPAATTNVDSVTD